VVGNSVEGRLVAGLAASRHDCIELSWETKELRKLE